MTLGIAKLWMDNFLSVYPRANAVCCMSSFIRFLGRWGALESIILVNHNTYCTNIFLLWMCFPCYMSFWNTDLWRDRYLQRILIRASLKNFNNILIPPFLIVLKNISNFCSPKLFQVTIPISLGFPSLLTSPLQARQPFWPAITLYFAKWPPLHIQTVNCTKGCVEF